MKASFKIVTKGDVVNLLLRIKHRSDDKNKKIAKLDLSYFDQQKMMPLPGHPDYEILFSDISILKSKMNSLQFSKFDDVSPA